MAVKFDDLNPLRYWDTKGIVTPENGPLSLEEFRATGPWARLFESRLT